MPSRFNMSTVQPEAYKLLFEMNKYIIKSGIGRLRSDLIKIRSSQINNNGCAYCVNMHTKGARKPDETEQGNL